MLLRAKAPNPKGVNQQPMPICQHFRRMMPVRDGHEAHHLRPHMVPQLQDGLIVAVFIEEAMKVHIQLKNPERVVLLNGLLHPLDHCFQLGVIRLRQGRHGRANGVAFNDFAENEQISNLLRRNVGHH